MSAFRALSDLGAGLRVYKLARSTLPAEAPQLRIDFEVFRSLRLPERSPNPQALPGGCPDVCGAFFGPVETHWAPATAGFGVFGRVPMRSPSATARVRAHLHVRRRFWVLLISPFRKLAVYSLS